MAKMLNPSGPGRTISSIPAKPKAIATARFHPTLSPKNSTAPRVTVNGNTCNTAVTFAKGMCISAVRKK